MKLQFTKMHGAGNDFIVIDAIHQDIDFTPAQWQRLADRRFGIGADQILVVEKPRLPGCDFRYRIYNNDGGEVEQCGNGARAFVKFVSEKGLSSKDSIRVETMAGVIAPRLEPDGSITVDMGAPVLEPALVPFDANGLDGVAQGSDTLWPLDLALPGQTSPVLVSVVSMGNPHAVQVVEDVDAQDLEVTGPRIEHHPRFPRRVNVGYMQIVDRQHVKLRVFERGAGETLACGTGACAAAVAGILRGLLDSPVRISARGGELSIAWQGDGHPVLMTGPAVTVFEGTIEL
ncbi:diaminopimelate epimerase [Janthinobacterium lividum]|uniref:diaminopimelate epimerase n=1 Tax=Janthinobacterium lividum TaxID=29581 RepID=UPI000873AB7B|nr:diaminopimelate epimerase [Janthinobacterium lividum]MCC7715202.1 diaminopimelate epimerase [Janthinobacterium lividum]OEZ53364.1 diaminopimelate epimerase [Janthinobacterium lividum]WQE29353.1 diaminopimelate epimerase [Janthinobacterium lividum]STQ94829.1 Diaminopimelate epimerase [Janthinobacterium lividum]